MRQFLLLIISILLMLSSLLSACQATATQSTDTTLSSTSEPVTLKIALLPIIDTLPMYIADQEGLFSKYGVKVEFVPVGAAPERDQLIAAGQADGMINETLSTFFFNREGIQVLIVRYALVPTAEAGHFFILASKDSGITTPEGLKGVEIGVSQGTIIEYVTERLLQAAGLSADEIKTIAVPKISDRMALLNSGGIKSGVMPDPLAGLAVQQGALVVMDDALYPQYGFSVITFRKAVIDAHPEAIRGFLSAIEEATALVNANPGKYTTLLSDKQLVPEALIQTYKVPPFPQKGVPTEAEWQDALEWAMSKSLLDISVPYADSVTSSYLP